MRARMIERGVLVLSLLISVLLSLGILWCLPTGNGSDENGHLAYAGYIWSHAALPTIERVTTPQATQHPFLYYVYLAAVRAALPAPTPVPETGTPIVLPYERRVTIDREAIPDPMLPQAAVPSQGSGGATVSALAPYLWRLSGIPLLVVVVLLVFRTARVVNAGETALAVLAAALAVLVPQLPATFATITNDQFGILFASAGFAPIAMGMARGRLTRTRLLLSGILFCLGFLSKATTIGAFVSAAFLIFFFERRPLLARLRDLLLLGLPSVLGAGWWYVARIIETGHADFVLSVAARHPNLLRTVPPDWFGHLQTLLGAMLSWMGLVGRGAIAPHQILSVIGAALPVMVVGGSIVACVARSASRSDRAIAGSFLAGLVLLVVLMLRSTQYSFVIHGRYLLTLVVPGTLACVVAMRHLFGSRAGRVLAACIVWFGLMGIDLLHGELIPRYHAPHDRFASPDFVAYLDLGAVSAFPFVEQGMPYSEPTWAPRPEGTAIIHPSEVRARVSGLDPKGTYFAWVRVHPLERRVAAEEFFADGLPLGGAIMPVSAPDWLRFAIPRAATIDGTVAISARSIAGQAVLSELLVTRVPISLELPPRLDGDLLRIGLASPAAERVPKLRASVRARGGALSASVDVVFQDGKCELAIPLGDQVKGALDLVLMPPASIWACVKVGETAVSPARRDVHVDSPGFDVVRIDAGTAALSTVLRLPDMKLVPGRYTVEFVDERSRPIPEGRLTLVWPDGRRVDAAAAELDVTDPPGLAPACEVVYAGGAPMIIDRLRLLHAEPWVYDLGITR